MSQPIDLRSDTVTRPTAPMRAAMTAAEVGDDVMRADPTVLELEARAAGVLGKEAALFVPSGTMANLVAILSQTAPGDELLTHVESHVYYYEAGAYAAIAGASIRFVDDADAPKPGVLTAVALERALRPRDDHFPTPRLLSLENTHNRGGGTVWPLDVLAATSAAAHEAGLAVHLDGARIWNAALALDVAPAEIARHADTISACFSKGLGCPVGSVVAGPRATIDRARHRRKMLGGGLRQAGVIAAAALYALDHHVEDLRVDHARARTLATRIAALDAFDLDAASVETNLVYATLAARALERGDGPFFEARLAEHGVLCFAESPTQLRFVTHRDLADGAVEEAGERIAQAFA